MLKEIIIIFIIIIIIFIIILWWLAHGWRIPRGGERAQGDNDLW